MSSMSSLAGLGWRLRGTGQDKARSWWHEIDERNGIEAIRTSWHLQAAAMNDVWWRACRRP